MTYTLTNMTSLGTVISEESSKDAQLFQQPLPLSDSDDAIQLDLFGAQRIISIKGVYTANDGTISTFIGQLDALVNGAQSTRTYASDKSGSSYTVLIQKVIWMVEEAGINKVNYIIDMVEAA